MLSLAISVPGLPPTADSCASRIPESARVCSARTEKHWRRDSSNIRPSNETQATFENVQDLMMMMHVQLDSQLVRSFPSVIDSYMLGRVPLIRFSCLMLMENSQETPSRCFSLHLHQSVQYCDDTSALFCSCSPAMSTDSVLELRAIAPDDLASRTCNGVRKPQHVPCMHVLPVVAVFCTVRWTWC